MSTNQLQYCKRCTNKKFGSTGIVCGLTMEKPTFSNTCPDFEPDTKVVKREVAEKEWSNSTKGLQIAGGAAVAIFIVFRIIRILMRMAE